MYAMRPSADCINFIHGILVPSTIPMLRLFTQQDETNLLSGRTFRSGRARGEEAHFTMNVFWLQLRRPRRDETTN
jgi:hypothetical protein